MTTTALNVSRHPQSKGRWWPHIAILIALAAAVIAQVSARSSGGTVPQTPDLSAASALLNDATFAERPGSLENAAQPQRTILPGYAAFIAGVGSLDPMLQGATRCGGQVDECGPDLFITLIAAQTVLTILSLIIVFLMSLDLSASREIASLTTVLTFLAGRFAEFAGLIFPFTLLVFVALAACYALQHAYRIKSWFLLACAGFAFGLTALIDMAYADALWVIASLVVLAWSGTKTPGRSWSRGLAGGVVFLVSAYLVLGPWHARNYLIFGDTALAPTQSDARLAQRVTYNSMGNKDYAAAMIGWLPGFGDGYGTAIFGQETIDRISSFKPGSYMDKAKSITQPIVSRYIVGEPLAYAATSIPLVLRGLWPTGSIVVIWGALLAPFLIRRLRATKTLTPFALAAGPPIVVAAVQGLTSANFPYTNTILVWVYAYCVAYVTGGIDLPLGWRRYASGV